MPGVLIVEAMAQVAGVLVLSNIPDRHKKLVLLVAVENAHFRKPVRPGDQLRIEMKVRKRKATVAKMYGTATVNGVVVAEAEMLCKLADRKRAQPARRSDCPSDADSSDRDRRPRRARRSDSADIGPYSSSARTCEIGARTRLMAHVFVEGPTEIGEDNLFFPYSTVGVAPQDLKYKGERSETRIGSRNKIREFVTIHRGTRAAAC